MTNLPQTTLICKTPEINLNAEYFGNRGDYWILQKIKCFILLEFIKI